MLSKYYRTPVIGTSANISELRNSYSVDGLIEYFGEVFGQGVKVDIVLDGGRLPFRRPSTVIELVSDRVDIIREGEINSMALEKEINELMENARKKINKKL